VSQIDSSRSADASANFCNLLQRAKLGEAGAVDRLFQRYRPYLRVVCSLRLPQLCQQREDASDIVQHTLIDANRGLPDFRGESEAAFEIWMARLLDRNILQSIRKHTAGKRDVRRELKEVDPADTATLAWHSETSNARSAESTIFRGEMALQLAQQLESLPEPQRLAVELRYLGQMPLKRIAEYMGKTPGAVAGLIYRGIEHLRESWPPEFGDIVR